MSAASPNAPVRRDLGLFSALLFICALLLVGATFIAAESPSASSSNPDVLPTPDVGLDDACTNFGVFWTRTGPVVVPPEAVEAVSNCRVAGDGSWFVATGIDDARLRPGTTLTDTERAATEAERTQLEAAIDAFDASIPASIEADLEGVYDSFARPVWGNLREGVGRERARDRYKRYAEAYLLDPDHVQLADYAAWLMEQRIDGYAQFAAACEDGRAVVAFACERLERALEIRIVPWPWELANQLHIDEYLADRVRNGSTD